MGNRKFTFIGEGQAWEGYCFTFGGEAEACAKCGYAKVCHGKLKVGYTYRVVEVKDKHVECPILGLAQLVVVETADVEAAVEAGRAVEGALIRVKPRGCPYLTCPHFDLCMPPALGWDEEKTFKVVEVSGFFSCPQTGERLAQVRLHPHGE